MRWETFTPGYVTASPALGSDGTVYTGSFDRSLYALDPATGAVRWSFPTADHIYSSPALAAGPDGATEAVYIGSADGSVYAVGADGTQLWRYDTGEPVRSSPVLGRAPHGAGTDPLRRLLERQALRARRRDRTAALVVRHHARGSRACATATTSTARRRSAAAASTSAASTAGSGSSPTTTA